jgi:cytochrome c peroxidase
MRVHDCTLAVIAYLCVAMPSVATNAQAHSAAPDPRWQALFKRPAEIPSPADNPLTPEKIALGATLFADVRLSGHGNRSCASCHQPARAFTDGRRRARGLSGALLRRNTPPLWNLAWGKHFSWDGRALSLEAQVQIPIIAGDEMGGDWPTVVRRLAADSGLIPQFAAAFPQEPAVSQATIAKALASYVRSLVSPATRFDAWMQGNERALSAAEVRGFQLFTGKGACVLCHVGWRFTDDRFHDIGLLGNDAGRGAVPGGTPGLMAFKTPGLREVAHTAPYMHDGSRATLEAVMSHYAGGFIARPALATNMNRGLRLSGNERSDLIAFLRTLSNEKGPARAQQAGPD